MSEKELIQWAVEKRLELLSDRQGLPRQEETIAKVERILDVGLKPGYQAKIGEILDGIRWGRMTSAWKGSKMACGS